MTQSKPRQYRTKTKAQRRVRGETGEGAREAKAHAWRIRLLVAKHRGNCALCGEPVLPSGHENGPDSATVDHIVPLSKGGRDSLENLQLAHRRCNAAKGAQVYE